MEPVPDNDYSLKTILKHSTQSRVVDDVQPYPNEMFPSDKLWKEEIPDYEALIKHLRLEGRLNKSDIMRLCEECITIFSNELNVLEVKAPCVVVGDIHGQFFDLLRLLELGGSPASTRYLFLGDYCDRGSFSCETLILLFVLKFAFPRTFFMLRGNHECRQMTAYFNFKTECLVKYDDEVYEAFCSVFDMLPLCAVLDNRFFCVHGGLSPRLETIDQIAEIDRFRETPDRGAFADLLWADPVEKNIEFAPNDQRGCSVYYGNQAAVAFLRRNNLYSIIRGHEVREKGFSTGKKLKPIDFPAVITIFSAPNYIDSYGNKGAIMIITKQKVKFKQFDNSPHPYWLPGFLDVFSWSLPFIAENITSLLVSMADYAVKHPPKTEERSTIDEQKANRIKAKIRAMGRMAKMFKTLRQESESLLKLKNLTNGKLPVGILSGGSEAIQDALASFDMAVEVDKTNERHPAFVDHSMKLAENELHFEHAEMVENIQENMESASDEDELQLETNK
ncbi:hypothetical protein PCE1_002147 [Barthelona sp. PCE]